MTPRAPGAEGGGGDDLDAAWARCQESDRRFRKTTRRLAAMLITIGARACAVVGCVWVALLAPWVPKPEHAEALAKGAALLAVAACLWRWADRLRPNPWPTPPAGSAARAGTRETPPP